MTTSIFNLQASLLILIPITLLSFFSQSSTSVDTLFSNQSLTGNHTLVSENQRFELGFFTPKDSNNRYLGIWYKNISPLTVVWVANRNTPLSVSSGVLKLGENGNILLLNGSESESVIWSSNQSEPGSPIVEKPIAKLLDTGNLVATQESDEKDQNRYRWQSFDHATDTLLPGMKLGWDLDAGLNNSLISWKSAGDPSAGSYSFLASSYAPELYLYSLNEQKPVYRSGPWNGKQFSGVPEMKPRDGDGIKFSFDYNGSRNYYLFTVKEDMMSRLVVNEYGKLNRQVLFDDHRSWNSYWEAPKDQCDHYKQCGAYGVCDTNDSPVCNCMKGFEPKNKADWRYRDGSGGCIRKTEFECGKNDGFLKVKNIKLPDCSKTYYNRNMNLKQCKEMCEKNCSCTAYSSFDIRNGGTGCVIWIGELFDIRLYVNGGQDLQVRLAASDLDHNHKPIAIIIIVVVILVASLSVLTAYFIWKKKKRTPKGLAKKRVNRVKSQEIPFFNMVLPDTRDVSEELKDDDLELPLIDFDIIAAITNNFSDSNKLGEGGFGCVYKGTSGDGRQIAVKRLSKHSGQGVEEFKNEVTLIAKLQHRNLVRLLGCCIDGEEKMLIYEYMPNRSLDSFLFDKTKSSILDWGKRFNIIRKIARGLLYLHQDSRFRIIHRDLKVSNILLDAEMNPKISDFGMARIFGGDATEGNTSRVVGTYGYMSPEYAMDGVFSVKSDVFSYGVLVLEIISGKKNRGFFSDRDESNLLGHAWRLWQEGKVLDLVDESMGEMFSIDEVMKCVQVGLLCVQEHAEDRPTISSVLVMFCSETATLPQPKQPGFTVRRIPSGTSSSIDQETRSVNQVTVTKLEPR